LFGILAPQSGNKAGGIGNERRLALLAAVRDRREERRVGFDQHLVSRQPFCRRLEVGRVLEGDDPRQRNEKAEVEALPRQFGRSGEAVEHAGYAPFPDGRGEDFGGVLFRISRVDHQRQSALPRSVDVGFETLALRGPVRLVVIIIESTLADRDHPRMIGRFDQGSGAEAGVCVGLVRMDADAGPNVRFALGNGDDLLPFSDWVPFTYPWNMTGQPAATVPCGFTRAGLPVGLQIIGRRFADATVLRAAAAFEEVRPWNDKRPLM